MAGNWLNQTQNNHMEGALQIERLQRKRWINRVDSSFPIAMYPATFTEPNTIYTHLSRWETKTDINYEQNRELQQKYRTGTDSNKYRGGVI